MSTTTGRAQEHDVRTPVLEALPVHDIYMFSRRGMPSAGRARVGAVQAFLRHEPVDRKGRPVQSMAASERQIGG